MTSVDNQLRAVATKTINKYGKLVKITRTVPGVYDYTTSSMANTYTEAYVKVVIEEWKQRRANADGVFATGLLFQQADKILTMAAANIVAPVPTDVFTFDGVSMTVPEGGVSTEYSGELPCIYSVVVRRT